MSEGSPDPVTGDVRKAFAQKLRELWKNSGLTQSEFASRASYPQKALSEVISGKVVPKSWETVERLLSELDSEGSKQNRKPIDWQEWKRLHEAARDAPRNGVIGSGVQTNFFQSDRDYTYIHGDKVAVGADNFGVIVTGNAPRAESSPATSEDDLQEDQARVYLSELENEITTVAKAARRRLLAYRFLRFSALAASAITPAIALLDAAPFVTALIGTVAFLAEGSIQLTRLNERAVLDTKRVSWLSKEFRIFRTQAEDYAEGNAFTLLVRRIEEIRQQNDNERLDVVQQSFGAHVATNDQRTVSR